MPRPDYILKTLNKKTGQRADVGIGWLNASGSIAVVPNPLVVIQNDGTQIFTLFPVRQEVSKPAETLERPNET